MKKTSSSYVLYQTNDDVIHRSYYLIDLKMEHYKDTQIIKVLFTFESDILQIYGNMKIDFVDPEQLPDGVNYGVLDINALYQSQLHESTIIDPFELLSSWIQIHGQALDELKTPK